MRTVLSCLLALALPASFGSADVWAQERSTDGIVLMRVTGKITVTLQDGRQREIDQAQIRTGTGTIVSRLGHIVTNDHVVSSGEFKTVVGGSRAIVKLDVDRVEACFPPSSKAERASPCVEAAIVASDAELDLAALTISGSDFPYVPLGDSAVARAGEAVSAAGYPLGEELDIGRAPGSESLAPTLSGGQLSALRTDDQGNLRYLQTSAPLNPGNSGGPLVDRDGFALGIVEARVRDATAIGFAIPINIVKEFLARSGVDGFLPSARLTLGYLFESPDKLIRMQAPAGFEDASRSRLRVDSGASLPGVALRIDRVASPWTLEQVEGELLQGRVFERGASTRLQSALHEERVLRGQAYSHAGNGSIRSLYAIVDLGDEKVVARYVGNAEQVAFSESVLAASLASLEVEPMLVAGAHQIDDLPWVHVAQPAAVQIVPPGWVVDAGGALPCRNLAAPRDSIVTSPRRDFTISFRVGRYDAGLDPANAAAQCAGRRGSKNAGDYHYTFSRLGVAYTVEGQFRASGSGVVQLEVVAPTPKFAASREVFARWTSELSVAPQ